MSVEDIRKKVGKMAYPQKKDYLETVFRNPDTPKETKKNIRRYMRDTWDEWYGWELF